METLDEKETLCDYCGKECNLLFPHNIPNTCEETCAKNKKNYSRYIQDISFATGFIVGAIWVSCSLL